MIVFSHIAKTWKSFVAEVERKPTKKFRERQRKLDPKPSVILPESGIGRIKPLQEDKKTIKK